MCEGDLAFCGVALALRGTRQHPWGGSSTILGEGEGRKCPGTTPEKAGESLSPRCANPRGSLHTQGLLLEADGASPAYIFFFNNVVLQNPAVTRREEKGIEHFSINTALLFVITCWYF